MNDNVEDIVERMIQHRMVTYGMDLEQSRALSEDFTLKRMMRVIENSKEKCEDILILKKELSIFVSLERYKP